MLFIRSSIENEIEIYDSNDSKTVIISEDVYTSLIKSGINIVFNPDCKNRTPAEDYINELYDKFIPLIGSSEYLIGEIVRAISRIVYRYYNDGDKIGDYYNRENVNPAFRFLLNKIPNLDKEFNVESKDYNEFGYLTCSKYEKFLDKLTFYIAIYIYSNYESLSIKTNESFFDYQIDEYDIEQEDDKDDEDY